MEKLTSVEKLKEGSGGQNSKTSEEPKDWVRLSGGIAGVLGEVTPKISRDLTSQEQSDFYDACCGSKFGKGGAHVGSMLWVAYKSLCGKDIRKLYDAMVENADSLYQRAEEH